MRKCLIQRLHYYRFFFGMINLNFYSKRSRSLQLDITKLAPLTFTSRQRRDTRWIFELGNPTKTQYTHAVKLTQNTDIQKSTHKHSRDMWIQWLWLAISGVIKSWRFNTAKKTFCRIHVKVERVIWNRGKKAALHLEHVCNKIGRNRNSRGFYSSRDDCSVCNYFYGCGASNSRKWIFECAMKSY